MPLLIATRQRHETGIHPPTLEVDAILNADLVGQLRDPRGRYLRQRARQHVRGKPAGFQNVGLRHAGAECPLGLVEHRHQPEDDHRHQRDSDHELNQRERKAPAAGCPTRERRGPPGFVSRPATPEPRHINPGFHGAFK